MCWLRRDIWKAGIFITGMLLFLVFIVGSPVSATNTHEGTSGLATPGTLQATPTEDATVTALNKEKLAQEVQQLKNQNEPDPFSWLRTNAAILLSTLVVVGGGLFGLFRWFGDRRDAQDKDLRAQAEERFKTAVTALGDEKEGTKIGGAILLRSFLHKEDKEIYKRYYPQIFDLAVAYLRLPRTPNPSKESDEILVLPHEVLYQPKDQVSPLPPTALSWALIVVFKEAFHLARNTIIGDKKDALPSLDATNIQLDNAFLNEADLKQAWMPQASLQKADLNGAYLNNARLVDANLSGAYLMGAHLNGAHLIDANLSDAHLNGADLSGANLMGANFMGAHLNGAIFEGAIFEVPYLSNTEVEGAIQPTASPSPLSSSNDEQAPLAPSTQENLPSSDAGNSAAAP